jgi:hypothetical protein
MCCLCGFQPVQRDAEVVAEDEQMFLTKLQTVLAKQAAPGGVPPAGAMMVATLIFSLFSSSFVTGF